jgi:hypothetical protein
MRRCPAGLAVQTPGSLTENISGESGEGHAGVQDPGPGRGLGGEGTGDNVLAILLKFRLKEDLRVRGDGVYTYKIWEDAGTGQCASSNRTAWRAGRVTGLLAGLDVSWGQRFLKAQLKGLAIRFIGFFEEILCICFNKLTERFLLIF